MKLKAPAWAAIVVLVFCVSCVSARPEVSGVPETAPETVLPPTSTAEPIDTGDVLLGPPTWDYGVAERVTIEGYNGSVMEAFVSRDSRWLLFNDRNLPNDDMDIHYAERIDDLTFRYLGPLEGANSEALDGVPSLGPDGWLYFVSVRSYAQNFSTLYRGRFNDGVVTDVELIPGLQNSTPGIVNFDAEITPDGERLYYVIGRFSTGSVPDEANLAVARRTADGFEPDPQQSSLLTGLNTLAREYAPSVSADGHELFFTRLPADSLDASIWRATHASTADPWGEPTRIAEASGFVEAITISGDGETLYFHQRQGNSFVLNALRGEPPG